MNPDALRSPRLLPGALTVAAALLLSGCSVTVGAGQPDSVQRNEASPTSESLRPESTPPDQLLTQDIERQIEQGIADQTDVQATVECPPQVRIAVGTTFACSATDSYGDTSSVLVTQEDEQGNVVWELQEGGSPSSLAGAPLDVRQLEQQIADGISKQTGQDGYVECPDAVAIAAGASFACSATVANTQYQVAVTQKDDLGNVTWEIADYESTDPLAGDI